MSIEINVKARTPRLRNGSSWMALAAFCSLLMACQHTVLREPTQAAVEAPALALADPATTAPASELTPAPDTVPGETEDDSLASLFRFSERLRSMNAAERKQELNAQSSQVPRSGAGPAPGTEPSPKFQMQLALALLQTREPVETARALGLLQRVAASTEPQASAYTALAHVLIDNLLTTRRLEDNLERTGQQLRDSLRRIDALNERLDAMRAIERSLNAPPSAHRPVRP